MTNNPRKFVGLEGYGLTIVERVPIEMPPSDASRRYLRTKKEKLGHLLRSVLADSSGHRAPALWASRVVSSLA